MNPPAQNPTYIPIDARNFYLATTSSTQYNVDDILTENDTLQSRIDANNQMLSDAQTSISSAVTADPTLTALNIDPAIVATPPITQTTNPAI